MRNPIYKDFEIKDIPLKVLEEMTPADIDEYLEHLNYYIFEGTEYRNGESAKARKLSALSNMYSFFNKRQIVSVSSSDTGDIYDRDEASEQTSLQARFGLSIGFYSLNKKGKTLYGISLLL